MNCLHDEEIHEGSREIGNATQFPQSLCVFMSLPHTRIESLGYF